MLPYKYRPLYLGILFYILCSLCFGLFQYFQTSKVLLQEVDTQLYRIAYSYPFVLGESHSQNLRTGNFTPEAYHNLVEYVSRYTVINNVSRIHEMRYESGVLKNIVASAKDEDIKNRTYTQYNELYSQPVPALFEALATQTHTYSSIPTSNGEFRSIFLPMPSHDDSVHLISVEMPLAPVKELLLLELKRTGLTSLLFFLFTLPLLYFSYKMVNKSYTEQKSSISTMQSLMEKYKNLSYTDPLTNMPNRRAFIESAIKEVAKLKRHKTDLCVLMIDIDHFKKINDTYGHLAGDLVLKEFGRKAQNIFRAHDSIGRYGGEEFVALLPLTSICTGYEAAERIRKYCEHMRIILSDNTTIHITISIGLTCISGDTLMDISDEEVLLSAIKQSDTALYHAKQTGRNKVCVYESDENSFPCQVPLV